MLKPAVYRSLPNGRSNRYAGVDAKSGYFNCQEAANVFWASAADLAVKRVCEKIRSRKEWAPYPLPATPRLFNVSMLGGPQIDVGIQYR